MSSASNKAIIYDVNTERKSLTPMQRFGTFLYLTFYSAIFSIHKIFCYDSYWHTKLGKIMLDGRTFAKYDVLSYTAQGKYWVNVEWLGSIIIYLFYRLGGEIWGFVLFQYICTFIFVTILFLIARIYTDKLAYSLMVIPVVLIIAAGRITARPHIISDVFFALYLYIWTKAQETRDYKKLYWLVPLHILWFNIHGAAKLGLGTIFLLWLGEIIDFYLKKSFALSPRFLKHCGIVILLCIIGGLINPFGINAYIYTFQTTFGDIHEITKYISEWQPVMSPAGSRFLSVHYLPLAILAVATSIIINLHNFRMSHLFAALGIFYLTWTASRFAPHFATISVLVVIYNFKDLRFKYSQHLATLATILLFILSIKVHQLISPKIIDVKPSSDVAPVAIVNFLEKNDIHGHPFHDYPTGAYLSFRRWPNEKVFMDGRTHVYPKELFMQYIDVTSDQPSSPETFKKLEKEYGIDYVILNTRNIISSPFLLEYLLTSSNWKLVFFDESGIILLKDIPKFKKTISQYEFKRLPADLQSYLDQIKQAIGKSKK